MRNTLIIILLPLLLCFSATVYSQNKLLLSKPGKVKNIIYGEGEYIKVYVKGLGKVSGPISKISDSVIIINYSEVIDLDKIEVVYRDIYGLKFLSRATLAFGALYFVLDAFNNAINTGKIFDTQTLAISGGLIGGGLLLNVLGEKKCRLHKNWQLQVLDFSFD